MTTLSPPKVKVKSVDVPVAPLMPVTLVYEDSEALLSQVALADRQKIKDEALSWVNGLLEEYGHSAIDEFPKGVRKSSTHCPIAQALKPIYKNVSVKGTSLILPDGPDDERSILMTRPLTASICEFIRRFDDGAYPELAKGHIHTADITPDIIFYTINLSESCKTSSPPPLIGSAA